MTENLKCFGTVLKDIDLKNYNTFKIGGKARCLVNVNDRESLVNLIKYLKLNAIKYFILGNGSNVVFSEKYFDGVIIKLDNLNKFEINKEKMTVTAESGVYFPILIPKIVKEELTGLEWGAGIPGTIGGSIAGNAGCYNACTFDYLISVTVLNPDGEIEVLKAKDIPFAYRHSMFKDKKDYTILEGEFQLSNGSIDFSNALILDRQKRRLTDQPLEYPSAGSIFRNPDAELVKDIIEKHNLKGPYAGHLIEMCDLKGKRIGGAEISSKHANFIVNVDNASSNDVKALIDIAHQSVLDKYGIDLIIEQEFVNWE